MRVGGLEEMNHVYPAKPGGKDLASGLTSRR